MKKSSFPILVFLSSCILVFLSSCHKPAATGQKPIPNFPPQMVGVWQGAPGIQDAPNWTIVFEADGSISKMYHRIWGPIVVDEGGDYRKGPDPDTYLIIGLGPVETEYDPVSKIIKTKIVVEEYEMKFPTGTLQGRMIDTLIGKASEDGKTWHVEWRNYGWLRGAQDPNISFIDEHPDDIFVFQKLNLSDSNLKSQ